MPAEAIVQPTAAPASSPNAAPARAAAPPAPSKSVVPAKPAVTSKAATPAPTAKVVSPFDQANEDLKKFADPDEEDQKPTAVPKASAKPAAKPAEKPAESAEEPEAKVEDGEKLSEEGKPAEPEKPGKTSPWKLVESYKQTNAKLQKEISELRQSAKPGELPKEHQDRFAVIEARNKELEDEIRHVNYSKSKEFSEKYQKPYEEAWMNAISDLKELVITNDDGSTRTATAQDLIALSNMPLGQARATAKAWFGDSADDVMAHRRNLRDLSDKQTKALEESKKFGSEREQQRNAEMQARQKAMAEESAKVWSQVNAEAVEKYEFLRPVEGETERNEKLEKATEFVDHTLKSNIGQAKTAEERDQIIKAHAAVRNRAVGFSVLKHENVALKAKVAELEKAIAEFQASEPTGGDPRHKANGEAVGDEMGSALGRLSQYVT